MPLVAKPKHYRDIEKVVTLAEAARRWGVHRDTINFAIDRANIAGLRCGFIVLVSVDSLTDWFGPPKLPPSE